jgi:hypothetical protein
MRSPDSPSPERLDALVDGRAAPTTAAERELARLIAELRAAEGASPALARRVRAAAVGPRRGPLARLLAALGGGGGRRRALALAPVCVLLAAGALSLRLATDDPDGGPPADATPTRSLAGESAPPPGAAGAGVALTLAAADPAALDGARRQARGVARSLGGRVLAARSGREATLEVARIVIAVPDDRLEEALARLSRSGRVLDLARGSPEADGGGGAADEAVVRLTIVAGAPRGP